MRALIRRPGSVRRPADEVPGYDTLLAFAPSDDRVGDHLGMAVLHDAASRRPPATATRHPLPVGQLDGFVFEKLCLWLVRAEGYAEAEHYGGAGADGGRDIVAFHGPAGRGLWIFQCKRRARLSRAELIAEVDRMSAAAAHMAPADGGTVLVVIATCAISARSRDAARERARAHGLGCEFWAATELDARIKQHPELVSEYFQVPLGWFVEESMVVPRELPLAPLRFINRAAELAYLDELLAQSASAPGPSVAVVSGLHGVGKSAIGRYWTNRRRAEFASGDLHGDFSRRRRGGRVDPSEVLADFLRDLGTADIAIPARFYERQRLFQRLTVGRRLLVLLDDVEEPAQALAVLPAGAGSVVVVTANGDLDALLLEGARHVELKPLDIPAARSLIADAIGERRAQAEEAQIVELIEFCGGLPIALCVCAARLASNSGRTVAWLLGQLRGAGPLHALSEPGGYEIESIFDFAYSDLSPLAALAYRRLSLHPGLDISLPAARALMDRPVAEVQQALDALHRARLIEVLSDDRYRMHTLVREHMASCLARDETVAERDRALQRLVDFYLATLESADRAIVEDRFRLTGRKDLAEAGGLAFGGPAEAFAWFTAARRNVMAVLRASLDREWDERVWWLTETLWPLCSSQKMLAEIVESHELAIQSARRLEDDGALARLCSQIGRVKGELGEYSASRALLAEANEAALRSGNARLIASVVEFGGVALLHEGDYPAAVTEFQRARSLFAAVRRARGVALQDYHLGWAHVLAGEPRSALGPLAEAHAAFTELGDTISLGRVLLRHGQALVALEQDEAARQILVEAIETLEACGVRFEQAEAYEALALSADRQQEQRQAEAHRIRAYRLYREIGHPHADRLLELLGLDPDG